MSTVRDESAERYAHLWSAASYRWVIWNAPEGSMIFDRATNRPEYIDHEPTLRDVLRRMREAGAYETDEYPGGPC
ncbi:hypothetical protein ACFQ2B_30695 [Streptomyces stramineus]|uniref:Uncharacterized protein n=1 Tax=Streptomyces stramineus TaxID=173861 RepID=A0ABN0ZN31_9ACTN